MGLIIDTNCLSHVFNKNDEKHPDFLPVYEWLMCGSGQLIYGGSRYLQELSMTRYVKIFSLLRTYKKAMIYDCGSIDMLQKQIEQKISDPDFDDPHLPAIVIVSKCRVICSGDTRSIKFVKKKDLYPKGVRRPSFYTGINNTHLLKPCYVGSGLLLNKDNQKKLEKQIVPII